MGGDGASAGSGAGARVRGALNVVDGNGLASGCSPEDSAAGPAALGRKSTSPLYLEVARDGEAARAIRKEVEDAAEAMRVRLPARADVVLS